MGLFALVLICGYAFVRLCRLIPYEKGYEEKDDN